MGTNAPASRFMRPRKRGPGSHKCPQSCPQPCREVVCCVCLFVEPSPLAVLSLLPRGLLGSYVSPFQELIPSLPATDRPASGEGLRDQVGSG